MIPYKKFNKDFCIIEDITNKSYTKHFEGAMTQGNGYIHIRGSYEEGLVAAPQNEEYMRMPANVTIEKPRHPRSKSGTFIPGVTGNHPLLNEEMVNLPFMFCISIYEADERFDMDLSKLLSYERWLDMRDGVMYRNFLWQTKNSNKIHCSYKRFVSMENPNILYFQGEFSAESECSIKLIDESDTDIKTNGYNHFSKVEKYENGYNITTDSGTVVKITSAFKGDCIKIDKKKDRNEFTLNIGPEQTVTFTKIVCFSTSRDDKNGLAKYKTVEDYLKENEFSIDAEYKKSEKIWSKMWSKSQIVIEGDEKAQYGINFCTYHLLRSINRGDDRVAICAKGFAGEAYFGHFFWDTEIYLLPFFLYTTPQYAKNLVNFRVKTLNGAKNNAKKLGYKGARYPWESSVSGEEQCPNWQYADNEIHITADVAFGMWHYYCNTGDIDFLKKAAIVYVEMSRYWCGRCYENKDKSIHINGVMGPDEYICFSNDNTYTNYMVKYALQTTRKVVDVLMEHDRNILKKLGTSKEEINTFMSIANRIVIEKKENLYLQCKGFDEFEEVDFDSVWKDKTKFFGSVISQEHNYRIKALKQADVLMLPYLFDSFMTGDELRANFDYYFPYTTHDSSLSNIIHSILCSKLGQTDDAYNLFNKSLNIDMDLEKCGAAEGIHIANCGGIWQAIIFGFAGLKWSYESEKPILNPKLPKQWKKLKFSLCFKNKQYNITITDQECKVADE